MIAVIIVAVALIGATCSAELALLAYLLYRDRGQFWRPGQSPPHIRADAPISTWHRTVTGAAQHHAPGAR